MNNDMMGESLNKRHRVYDDILTPEEIVEVGFTYVPAFPYVNDDGTTIEGSVRKLKCRFDHSWDEDSKLKAKEQIVRELKYSNCLFLKKVYLTSFASGMDYSNCCYDVHVIVSLGKHPPGEKHCDESIDPNEFNPKVIEQLLNAKKNVYKACFHKKSIVCYRDDYAVGDLVVWKEFCRDCNAFLGSGFDQYVKPTDCKRDVIISPTTKYDEGYVLTIRQKNPNEH